MAEGGAVGLARAETNPGQASKEELQQRMDDARHAITGTVTDIKNSVVHQYEVVKDTLDWREQVKRRPIAWSAGALGGGLLLGWGIASAVRGHRSLSATDNSAEPQQRALPKPMHATLDHETRHESDKPGLMKQIKESPAFRNLQSEGAGLAKSFLDYLSRIGHEVLLPAISSRIRNWLNDQLREDKERRRST